MPVRIAHVAAVEHQHRVVAAHRRLAQRQPQQRRSAQRLDQPAEQEDALAIEAVDQVVALDRGQTLFGAGIDTNIELASIKAIVSALNRVGLSAEARMIAAEAVARG